MGLYAYKANNVPAPSTHLSHVPSPYASLTASFLPACTNSLACCQWVQCGPRPQGSGSRVCVRGGCSVLNLKSTRTKQNKVLLSLTDSSCYRFSICAWSHLRTHTPKISDHTPGELKLTQALVKIPGLRTCGKPLQRSSIPPARFPGSSVLSPQIDTPELPGFFIPLT